MAKKKDDDLTALFKTLSKRAKSGGSSKSTRTKKSSKNNDVLTSAYNTAKKIHNTANSISSTTTKVVPTKNKQKTRNIIKIAICVVLLIALIVSIPFTKKIEQTINKANYTFTSTVGEYSVHFIDVGQGDCTLIKLPDNKLFMIDTGPGKSKNNLMKYLNALNITTIDYVCFTHYDEDHIGNGVAVFDAFDIKNVYIPKVYSSYEISLGYNTNSKYREVTSTGWNLVSQAIYEEKCTIKYNQANEQIRDEEYGYSIDFWMPINDKETTANDYSPFIFVNLQNTKYLFTGDASNTKEKEFLTKYADLVANNSFDVDVFQLGHHGSNSSNSLEFLNAIKPEIAIVSCGANNSYGHPGAETMQRLSMVGCELKRTDQLGSIVLTKDGVSDKKVANDNADHVSGFYLEWKYVIIVGGILVLLLFVSCFVKKKKM